MMRSKSDDLVFRTGGVSLIGNQESIVVCPREESGIRLLLLRVALIGAWAFILVFGVIVAFVLLPSMWLCRRVLQIHALCPSRR